MMKMPECVIPGSGPIVMFFPFGTLTFGPMPYGMTVENLARECECSLLPRSPLHVKAFLGGAGLEVFR